MTGVSGGHLIAREPAIATLRESIELAESGRGGSVVICGDAGIGKSALAGVVEDVARQRGFRILRTVGSRAGGLGLEGLHEMLHGSMDAIDALPPRQRTALRVAFGFDDGPAPDRLLLGIAVLGAVEEIAASHPVLLVVEDGHWLDPSSAELIGFLAPRLSSVRALLVATTRMSAETEGWADRFAGRIDLQPLSAEEAERLVVERWPELGPATRRRIVREAQGNPLALTEFGAQSRGSAGADALPGPPTMTERLERTFLAETLSLPERTRVALIVAAAGDGAAAEELVAAWGVLGLTIDDAAPATTARLLRREGDGYRFRHPLIASAVYDHADQSQRSRAQLALAEVVHSRTGAARHRAAAAAGWDDAVADELESVGTEESGLGAHHEAAAVFRDAARLSSMENDRARRLALAAEAARKAGAVTDASDDARRARTLDRTADTDRVLATTEWMLSQTAAYPGRSVEELVEVASRSERDIDRVEVLVFAAVRCYILGEDEERRRSVARALDAATSSETADLAAIGLALLEPNRAVPVARALARFTGTLSPSDGILLNCLAFAAEEANDLADAEEVWTEAIRRFHDEGRVADELSAVCGRAGVRTLMGDHTGALADAEQSLSLSIDLDLGVIGAMAAACVAVARASRGEIDLALAALDTVTSLGGPQPFARIAAVAAWARGIIALAEHRPEDAVANWEQARVSPPIWLWAGADLAEAAVRAGRTAEAEEWIARANESAEATGSARLLALIERTRALLAEDSAAADHFARAIVAGATSSDGAQARTRLLYGEWLRRERRIVEARAQLTEALGLFRRASLPDSVRRTESELRAAGVTGLASADDLGARSLLTPRELHVAQLAAEGLTNKQIADRVYLSHRTVAAHLRTVFAKLGVSRRAQLGSVLRADAAA